MKRKLLFVLTLVILTAVGTAIPMHFAYSSSDPLDDPDIVKVVKVTEDPKEDIKVGEIAFKKIKEEVNITSGMYEADYPFVQAGLDKKADWWDKTKHTMAGKEMKMMVYTQYELRSNLLDVEQDDVVFNKETGILHVTIPPPLLRVTLDTEKTEMREKEGWFSGGYSEEERMRLLDNGVQIAETSILEDEEKMTEAKEDITSGLIGLLSLIDTVKEVDVTFGNQDIHIEDQEDER
jgi:hypothetical protein